MFIYFRRALRDFFARSFLNVISIGTIALAVIVVGTFAIFFINAEAVMEFWTKSIRMMAYIETNVPEDNIPEIEKSIRKIQGVENVRFISKDEALRILKTQMKSQSSLIDGLNENPLPHAFEISMNVNFNNENELDHLAWRIESLPYVEEVEYGRKWLERFRHFFNLFQLTGYSMGCLFFMAAIFFVANTIRLVLYSRREEVEVMRLVGASDSFIKIPFYIQGIIQGGVGGIIGIGALFAVFRFISDNISGSLLFGAFSFGFLPPKIFAGILIGSILTGWIGCYISLRQFLK